MKNPKRKEHNLFGDTITCHKIDVLKLDLHQNHFSLITGCWCLGFFDEDNILTLLKNVRKALAEDGVAVFKESIPDGDTSEKGNDFYDRHPEAKYETLFEKAGFEYKTEARYSFHEEGEEDPYHEDVFWKLTPKTNQPVGLGNPT